MATSPSPLPVLLPEHAHLDVESLRHADGAIVMVAGATGDTASCPLCGVCSCHVHSQYGRTLRDLPWQGVRDRVALRTRRFYCRSENCRRKIFAERFPNLTVAYDRQTNRHAEVLKRIGYDLGGEAGFQLASELGLDSSPDTILRILKRNADTVVSSQVKVLGVDDWAWKKGLRYGTILVDLERHRPIDLLPDRESESLEKWLETHEIISRDRAGAYAEGARKGALDALQVADRFHFLCNLTQTLQRLLERLAVVLRRSLISQTAPAEDSSSASVTGAATTTLTASWSASLNRHQQQSQHRRERRKERYEAVCAASQRGLTQRAIAQEFGLSIRTVRRFLQATEFPEQAPRRRRTGLEPYREYLEKRWAEGCRNATRLCRELQDQGYTGQRSRVKEYLQPWRTQERNRREIGVTATYPGCAWLLSGSPSRPNSGNQQSSSGWRPSPRAVPRLPRQNAWRVDFAIWSRTTKPASWIPGWNPPRPPASKNSAALRRECDVIVRPSSLALINPGATVRLKGKSIDSSC
jgi:transposase